MIETLSLEPLIPVTDGINRSSMFADITVWFRKCITCKKIKSF